MDIFMCHIEIGAVGLILNPGSISYPRSGQPEATAGRTSRRHDEGDTGTLCPCSSGKEEQFDFELISPAFWNDGSIACRWSSSFSLIILITAIGRFDCRPARMTMIRVAPASGRLSAKADGNIQKTSSAPVPNKGEFICEDWQNLHGIAKAGLLGVIDGRRPCRPLQVTKRESGCVVSRPNCGCIRNDVLMFVNLRYSDSTLWNWAKACRMLPVSMVSTIFPASVKIKEEWYGCAGRMRGSSWRQ